MTLRSILIAACAGAVGVAVAADSMPTHKAGLWEIVNNVGAQSGAPPINEKICLDASTEEAMHKLGAGISQRMCSKTDMHSTASQVMVDTECTIGSSKMTGHSVTTFTGNTAFHTESKSHFDPALFGRADTQTTSDGKWVGACPADMKPGDVIMSGGRLPKEMRMNLTDMLNRQQ